MGEFNDAQKIASKLKNYIALITVLDFHIFLRRDLFTRDTKGLMNLNRNTQEAQQRGHVEGEGYWNYFPGSRLLQSWPPLLGELSIAIHCK